MHFLFIVLLVNASLTIYAQIRTFAGSVVQNYRVVGRSSHKINIRPPFPPVIRTKPPIILD